MPKWPDIVDGLTKISSLTFRSSAEQQVENYRKLLLSIAKDARVIIIKLADRLHNMRTLDPLPPEKRVRIATETREIYAPLAHRFGMAGIKAELEDLAFKYLEPEDYKTPGRSRSPPRRPQREQMILKLQDPAGARAQAGRHRVVRGHRAAQASLVHLPEDEEARQAVRRDLRPDGDPGDGSNGARVLSRPGHHPSQLDPDPGADQGLHRESQDQRVPVAAHHDLRAGRPAVRGPDPDPGDAPDCGVRYRGPLALQDRRPPATSSISQLGWFRQLLELQQDAHTPEEFLEFLKIDLYQDEIFVFTPQGDVKQLPKGATPIDFAFMVHTEVGLHCQGAKVNGRIAPLHRELRNGDTIEILTGPNAKPSRDWLAHVHTARARHKIKAWIRHQEEQESVRSWGGNCWRGSSSAAGWPLPNTDQLGKAAESLGLADGR